MTESRNVMIMFSCYLATLLALVIGVGFTRQGSTEDYDGFAKNNYDEDIRSCYCANSQNLENFSVVTEMVKRIDLSVSRIESYMAPSINIKPTSDFGDQVYDPMTPEERTWFMSNFDKVDKSDLYPLEALLSKYVLDNNEGSRVIHLDELPDKVSRLAYTMLKKILN